MVKNRQIFFQKFIVKFFCIFCEKNCSWKEIDVYLRVDKFHLMEQRW